jgi:hypothetical protein
MHLLEVVELRESTLTRARIKPDSVRETGMGVADHFGIAELMPTAWAARKTNDGPKNPKVSSAASAHQPCGWHDGYL